MIQSLLGRMIVIRPERSSSWRVGKALDTSPVVQSVRRLALRHGFEHLGAKSERLAFTGRTIFNEEWAQPEQGIHLSITEGYYAFTTYFTDGTELITSSLSAPATSGTPQIVIYGGRGGFRADLEAHTERVLERENDRRRAVRSCSLAARVAGARAHYRSRMGLLHMATLLAACVFFPILPLVWLSACVGFSLAPAPVLGPLLSGVTFCLLNGLLYLHTPEHPDRARVSESLRRELRSTPTTRPTQKAYTAPPALPQIETVRPRAKETAGATRCPFCHDCIEEPGVACVDCRARHHEDCWDLHARCSTCASPRRNVYEAEGSSGRYSIAA